MNFAAKNQRGQYWCGNSLGWVACRFCALRMNRATAHVWAHSTNGKVVRIVKPTSHAIVSGK